MPTEHVGFVLHGSCAGTKAAVNSQVNAMATSCPDDRLSLVFVFVFLLRAGGGQSCGCCSVFETSSLIGLGIIK